jgi:hypothetical protein
MNRTASAVAAAVLLLPAAAKAEVVMFSQRGFQGARYALERESGNMNFSPRSIRLAQGEAWDLCPRPFFGGACLTVSATTDPLSLPRAFSGMVRSARPSKGASAAGAAAEAKPKPDPTP